MPYPYVATRTKTQIGYIGQELANQHPLLAFIREEMLTRLTEAQIKADNFGAQMVETNDITSIGMIVDHWRTYLKEDIQFLDQLDEMGRNPGKWLTDESRAEWEAKLKERRANVEGGPKNPEL